MRHLPFSRQGEETHVVSQTERVVGIRVVADSALEANAFWKLDFLRVLTDVNRHFPKTARIRFKIRDYTYWDPRAESDACREAVRNENIAKEPRLGRTMASFLSSLRGQLDSAGTGQGGGPAGSRDRDSCDIVLGLIPEREEGPAALGIADYLHGIVIIKFLKSKGAMTCVLLHELCHLFGAVDLKDSGLAMSTRKPAFRFDEFTTAIICVNRNRSFRPGEFPLGAGPLTEAITLYTQRYALGRGEWELELWLRQLQTIRAAQR